MEGAGCRVQGAGCRVQGAGCRVKVVGCVCSRPGAHHVLPEHTSFFPDTLGDVPGHTWRFFDTLYNTSNSLHNTSTCRNKLRIPGTSRMQ